MTGLCHFEIVLYSVLNNTTQWLHYIKKLMCTPRIIWLTKPLLNFKVSHRYQTHRAHVIDFQVVKKELYIGNVTHIFVWVTYVFPGWQFCFWWFVANVLFSFMSPIFSMIKWSNINNWKANILSKSNVLSLQAGNDCSCFTIICLHWFNELRWQLAWICIASTVALFISVVITWKLQCPCILLYSREQTWVNHIAKPQVNCYRLLKTVKKRQNIELLFCKR